MPATVVEITRIRPGFRVVEALGGKPMPAPPPAPKLAVDAFDPALDAFPALPENAGVEPIHAALRRIESALAALNKILREANVASPRQPEPWFLERKARRDVLAGYVKDLGRRLTLAKQAERRENIAASRGMDARFREVAHRLLPKVQYDVIVDTATAEWLAADGEGG